MKKITWDIIKILRIFRGAPTKEDEQEKNMMNQMGRKTREMNRL